MEDIFFSFLKGVGYVKNVDFPHFNTKLQILKSPLLYGEARIRLTCDTAGPLYHNWYKAIKMADATHLLCKTPPCRRIQSTVHSVQAGQLGASGPEWAWEQVAVLELVSSLFLALALLCVHFPDIHGISVLLVNDSPRRPSKISCGSNVFWVRGQRVAPCSGPEQHSNYFLSHHVTAGLLSTGSGFQFCTSANWQQHRSSHIKAPGEGAAFYACPCPSSFNAAAGFRFHTICLVAK